MQQQIDDKRNGSTLDLKRNLEWIFVYSAGRLLKACKARLIGESRYLSVRALGSAKIRECRREYLGSLGI